MTTYAFPSSIPTETEWTYVANDNLFQARNASVQASARGPDYWTVKVRLLNRNGAERAQLQAFLTKIGRRHNFTLKDHAFVRRGSGAGTPLINGVGLTGNSIATDGWTPNAAGVLLEGDLVQIRNQLVMCTADVTANGSGQATLTVMPAIRIAPTDNSAIVTSAPTGIFRVLDPSISWGQGPGIVFSDFQFTAVEDVLA